MNAEWISLLTAAGIGSLLTSLLQHVLRRRGEVQQVTRKERKEAFVGLLEAWRDQDKEGVNPRNRYDVGHWIFRCELVGSAGLCDALHEWQSAEPGTAERRSAWISVKNAMKRDLK